MLKNYTVMSKVLELGKEIGILVQEFQGNSKTDVQIQSKNSLKKIDLDIYFDKYNEEENEWTFKSALVVSNMKNDNTISNNFKATVINEEEKKEAIKIYKNDIIENLDFELIKTFESGSQK